MGLPALRAVAALVLVVAAASSQQSDVEVLPDAALFDHLTHGRTITVARVTVSGPTSGGGFQYDCDVEAVLAPTRGRWLEVPYCVRCGELDAQTKRVVFVSERVFFFSVVKQAIPIPNGYDVAQLRERIDAWTRAHPESPDAKADRQATAVLAAMFPGSYDLVGVPPSWAIRASGVMRRHVAAWVADGRRVVCVRTKWRYPEKAPHKLQVLRTLHGDARDVADVSVRHDGFEMRRFYVVALRRLENGAWDVVQSVRVIGSRCAEVELLQQWIGEELRRR